MRFDIFLSICQTEVDGVIPSERLMLQNFFSQVERADQLGFETAWVAETHLSCQVQKRNPGAVIPNFKGEIGLNTDVLQMAHQIFARTKRLNVGSAIRNILCNGGPMAHAESIRMFLSLHSLGHGESRILDIGFASGRFPFANEAYGISPRNELEVAAWPALRGLVFQEATEIFLRFLRGDVFNSREVRKKSLNRKLFRSDEDWRRVKDVWQKLTGITTETSQIEIAPFWNFPHVGVIPFESPLELLRLTIGAHDAESQIYANQFMPVGVFNLSITPGKVIEETHERMQKAFHKSGGEWTRSHMPRTVLVFIDETPGRDVTVRRKRAKESAAKAISIYWQAVEGTLDPSKIEAAVDNALVGTADDIAEQMRARYNPGDRLMLWFDFNNHDTQAVEQSMTWFMERVAPKVN